MVFKKLKFLKLQENKTLCIFAVALKKSKFSHGFVQTLITNKLLIVFHTFELPAIFGTNNYKSASVT